MWLCAACGVTGGCVCVVKRLKGFSGGATVCGLGESSDCITPLETTNPNPPKSKHGQNTVRHVKHLPCPVFLPLHVVSVATTGNPLDALFQVKNE